MARGVVLAQLRLFQGMNRTKVRMLSHPPKGLALRVSGCRKIRKQRNLVHLVLICDWCCRVLITHKTIQHRFTGLAGMKGSSTIPGALARRGPAVGSFLQSKLRLPDSFCELFPSKQPRLVKSSQFFSAMCKLAAASVDAVAVGIVLAQLRLFPSALLREWHSQH